MSALPRRKQIVHAVDLFDYISPEYAPKACNGLHVHNQSLWREFFVTMELLQNQCLSCGRDLVAVMNEIRLSDGQGAPSRRQLYSQHRALSRALMDSELQCLRRKGQQTITRLQSLSKSISSSDTAADRRRVGEATEASRSFGNRNLQKTPKNPCEHVTHRLNAVMAIFVEVDRAARRLEQLTEQRRERLREITRQQALEDEMNEVIWIVCETFLFRALALAATTRWWKRNDEFYFLRPLFIMINGRMAEWWPTAIYQLSSNHQTRCNNFLWFTLTICGHLCLHHLVLCEISNVGKVCVCTLALARTHVQHIKFISNFDRVKCHGIGCAAYLELLSIKLSTISGRKPANRSRRYAKTANTYIPMR